MADHLTFHEYLEEKPLTPQQRMKRARTMKRLAPKIQLKKKLAMKKKAPMEKIKKRAEKKAKDIVRKKFSDGDYGSMSFAQKIQIDKKVEKKKALVKKIAKKLVPKMKKAEADRLTKLRGKKEATASQQKENKMNIKDKETQSVAEKVKEVTGLKIAEGRMKELHGYINDGLSAEEIIKKMKLKKTPDMIKFINGLMKEGNAFGKAVVDAKKAGKKKFKFNGKDYKVEGDEVNEIEIDPVKKKLVGAGTKKESVDLEEAIKPEVFVKGGDAKVTKREIDKILSKIFINNKLAKQVEASKAYKDGFGGKVKKNPYKKDTADFHLFILGQQSAEVS